jgi:hypothetical protein
MKTKSIVAGIGLILSLVDSGKAGLIAYWDFSNQTYGPAPAAIAASDGAQTGTASIDLSHISASYDANIDVTTTTKNEIAGDYTEYALALKGGTSDNENGKSILFSLSMTGDKNLVLTYATERSSTGFTGQNWSYSTDGGASYTSFSSISAPGSYATETVNFSTVPAINNSSSVLFELTFSGATSSTGSDHLDNIQFNADPIPAVPEPAESGTISALGLLGICVWHEWRQHRVFRAGHWLELLVDSGFILISQMAELLGETRQLIAIFTINAKKVKENL